MRIASLEKQAHVDKISHIIKTSNATDKVEKATIETAFLGMAEGLGSLKVHIPPALIDAIKNLGIKSPEQIVSMYHQSEKVIDKKNPTIAAMLAKIESQSSPMAKISTTQEMVNLYKSDPESLDQWLGGGNMRTANIKTIINVRAFWGVVFHVLLPLVALLIKAAWAATKLWVLISIGAGKVLLVIAAAYLAVILFQWSAQKLSGFLWSDLLPLLMKAKVQISELSNILWAGLKGISKKVTDTFSSGVSKLKSWLGFGSKTARYGTTTLLPL